MIFSCLDFFPLASFWLFLVNIFFIIRDVLLPINIEVAYCLKLSLKYHAKQTAIAFLQNGNSIQLNQISINFTRSSRREVLSNCTRFIVRNYVCSCHLFNRTVKIDCNNRKIWYAPSGTSVSVQWITMRTGEQCHN